MVIFKRIWAIARINFQRWKADHRIWLIFAITTVLLFSSLRGLVAYGIDSDKTCTGYLLPFLFRASGLSIGMTKVLLYIGVMLILCDAPFIYSITPYMVIRSRRNHWWRGECLYIFLTTFLYMLFITLCSTIIMIPVITLGDSWGQVAEAFANGTKEMSQIDLINTYKCYVGVSSKIISYLYPIGAQIYTFFTAWISMFILGLIQYLINLVSKSMIWGTFVATMFIFIDPAFSSWSDGRFAWIMKITPVSWSSLEHLKTFRQAAGVTIPFVVITYVVLILALLTAIWWASKKVAIEVRGEV